MSLVRSRPSSNGSSLNGTVVNFQKGKETGIAMSYGHEANRQLQQKVANTLTNQMQSHIREVPALL